MLPCKDAPGDLKMPHWETPCVAELGSHLRLLGELLEDGFSIGHFSYGLNAQEDEHFQGRRRNVLKCILHASREAALTSPEIATPAHTPPQLPGCVSPPTQHDEIMQGTVRASVGSLNDTSKCDAWDEPDIPVNSNCQEEETVETGLRERKNIRKFDTKRMSQRVDDLMKGVGNLKHSGSGNLKRSYGSVQDTSVRFTAVQIVHSTRFEMLMAFIISLNALLMGVHADWKAGEYKYYEDPNDIGVNSTYDAIDRLFTVVFLAEILLRIFAEGYHFCLRANPNLQWNIFDSVIILICLFDEIVLLCFGENEESIGSDVSVLRLVRVLRLARTLRILRVMRFFRDLRVMVAGILESIKSLSWAILLLLLITYLFSVCILETLCTQTNTKYEGEDYSSLPKTMYTLYKSVLGGVDWGDVSDPLFNLSYILVFLFMLYVAFAVMCVLNIITGVFVENANKITVKAEGEALMEELEQRKQWLDEVKNMFYQTTGDQAALSAEAFEIMVTDIKTQAMFRKLGIELERHHASGLFSLLDFDSNGSVDAEEFCTGLDQLHGQARSIDVVRILHGVKKLDNQMNDVVKVMQDQANASLRADIQAKRALTSLDHFVRLMDNPRETPLDIV